MVCEFGACYFAASSISADDPRVVEVSSFDSPGLDLEQATGALLERGSGG